MDWTHVVMSRQRSDDLILKRCRRPIDLTVRGSLTRVLTAARADRKLLKLVYSSK